MDHSTKKILNLMADLIWFPKNTPDVKPLTGVPEGVAFSMKIDKSSLQSNNKNHNTNTNKELNDFN